MWRQLPLARSPPRRQVYLYLHWAGFLRTAGASTQPDQQRRRKPPTTYYFHWNQNGISDELTDKVATSCGTANTSAGIVWKRTRGSISSCISRLNCKTSIMILKQDSTITISAITRPRRDGLLTKTRLGWQVVVTCISLRLMYWVGLILLVGLERKLLILHVILNTSFYCWLDSANVKKCLRQGLNWMRIQLLV